MGRKKLFQSAALVVIAVLAAMLRLHGLGHQSLWRDETNTRMMSYAYPQLTLFEMQAPGESLPPPYFVFIKGWMRLFGTSEISVRMPSAICGIAAVVVMFCFGRRLVPDRNRGFLVGVFAALLLCMSRFHIAYSQEARPYSIAFLFGLISCDALGGLLREKRVGLQWVYFLSTVAMFWMHPFMLLLFLAQVIFIGVCIVARRLPVEGIGARRWMTLIAAAGLCCTPWMGVGDLLAHGGQAWMPKPDLHEIVHSLVGGRVVIVFIGLLWIGAAVYSVRKKDVGPILGILVAVIPVAVPVLLSQGRHSLFVTRYGIAALIGLYVTAAYGAALLGRYGGCVVILGVMLAMSPPILADYQTRMNAQVKPDLRAVAMQIERTASPDDAVYCTWDWLDLSLTDYLVDSRLRRINTIPETGSPLAESIRRIWLVTARKGDSREVETATTNAVIGKAPYRVTGMWLYTGATLSELTARNGSRTTP